MTTLYCACMCASVLICNVRASPATCRSQAASDSRLALTGQAQVGAGTLSMTGEFIPSASGGPRAQLKLRGAQLALVRLPDIEADAALDMEVILAPQAVDLAGRVSWSRLQIHLPSLPENTGEALFEAFTHVCSVGRAHPKIAVDDVDHGEAVDLRRILQCVL